MTQSKFFDAAQNFFIDSQVVAGASQIRIASIDLFFKSKPTADTNHSGIVDPTVSVFIVPTTYGVPTIEFGRDYDIARLQYNDIISSSDASVGSRFRFDIPILVDTDKEYSVIIKFDGSSSFVLWKSKQGDYITGTTVISPGPTGKYTGDYFENISLSYDEATQQPQQKQYQGNWQALADTDLKFNINASRYFLNGEDVTANNVAPGVQIIGIHPSGSSTIADGNNFIIPSTPYEFFTFNQDTSIKSSLIGAQLVYQNTFSYPGGLSASNGSFITASITKGSDIITANASYPNGAPFSWNAIFSNVGKNGLVVKSGNIVNARFVSSIISDTMLQVYEPLSDTNAAAQFLITPIGRIDYFNKGYPFGVYTSMLNLTSSTANATVRFVNNVVEFGSIVAGGNGYSNNDVLWVKGWENVVGIVEGGYAATANIRTNSSGTITGLYWSNNGCGFVNATNIQTIITSNNNPSAVSNTSAGTGASFGYNIGATLYSELTNSRFSNTKCVNIPMSEIIPYFEVENPPGSSYNLQLKTQYIRRPETSTHSKYGYYIDGDSNGKVYNMSMFQTSKLLSDSVPCFISRSNEWNTKYMNGSGNDLISPADISSRNLRLIINHDSNNDFVALSLNNWPSATISKYVVNNDYTNEHTDQGSAWAKGISTKFSFARLAGDLVVRTTTYRPVNTDIKVYARIFNSSDPESFDDKNWTLLNQTDGIGLYSSSSKLDDYVYLEYSLPQTPNTGVTLAGSVTTSNGSAVLTGTGTNFSNTLVNSLVKLYNPLFGNNHVVAAVQSVTNATSLTLDYSVANNGLVGSGLFLDKIDYPMQVFNNIQSANVARYYNSTGMKFDGFDTVQLKLVLLSDMPNRVPRIDDFQAIGTST